MKSLFIKYKHANKLLLSIFSEILLHFSNIYVKNIQFLFNGTKLYVPNYGIKY